MGKRVLDRSFLTVTSDFGKVERISATISGVGDPVIPAADLSTIISCTTVYSCDSFILYYVYLQFYSFSVLVLRVGFGF